MLADDMACNPRNPHPSRIFNNMDQKLNLYDAGAEVDYRGYEVTVDSFLDVLKGEVSSIGPCMHPVQPLDWQVSMNQEAEEHMCTSKCS